MFVIEVRDDPNCFKIREYRKVSDALTKKLVEVQPKAHICQVEQSSGGPSVWLQTEDKLMMVTEEDDGDRVIHGGGKNDLPGKLKLIGFFLFSDQVIFIRTNMCH